MVDETSRLSVEVDGTGAARDVDKITRAFQRLQAQVTKTSLAFARLGKAGATRSLSLMRKAASGAFRVLSGGINIVKKLGSTFFRVFKSMAKIALIAAGVFAAFAKSIVDAGNKMNKFVNTLVILKGNTKDAVIELQLLFDIANKLGTSFTAAATPFTKFAAAAAGTLSDQSIRDVFEAFSTVGVALQLTQSEVTGVFLALQQIASKGVVSMEELRLQLAERVPGAMRLAAISMGMSMKEFEDAVRFRTINAGEFLEKFSAKLKATFGVAAELASVRLFAGIQRLGNAFVKFRQEIFQTGFETGLTKLVKAATDFLNNNPALAKALGNFSKGIFEDVADFLDGLSSDKVVKVINTIIGVFETLVNSINTLVFHIQKAFGSELGPVIKNMKVFAGEFNEAVNVRNEARDRLFQTNVREEHLFRADTFRPMTDTEVENAITNMAVLNENINIAKALLQGSRMAAKELGLELGVLPKKFDELVTGRNILAEPIKVEFRRIENEPATQGIQLTGQPNITGPRPATLDALDQAERLATIQMPEFYDKIISGEIVAGMEDLARVSHELNVLTDSQALFLNNIKTLEQELAVLRSSTSEADDASKLAEVNLKLVAAIELFISKEKERLALKKEFLKLMDQEDKKQRKILTFQEELERTFTSVRDVMINSIKKTEDAFVELAMTGKTSFSDLANSIVSDLIRMAIQAFLTRFIFGPLLSGLSNSLGDALGGTFDTPGPGDPTGHTGGIIGGDTMQRRSSFERLRSNESPIIVQTGEGIFTKQQMASMAPISQITGALSRVSRQPQITSRPPIVNVTMPGTKVEIINNTGEESRVERSKDPNGDEVVRLIIGTINKDIATDGSISKTLRGKFGLKTTTGLR